MQDAEIARRLGGAPAVIAREDAAFRAGARGAVAIETLAPARAVERASRPLFRSSREGAAPRRARRRRGVRPATGGAGWVRAAAQTRARASRAPRELARRRPP